MARSPRISPDEAANTGTSRYGSTRPAFGSTSRVSSVFRWYDLPSSPKDAGLAAADPDNVSPETEHASTKR